MTVKIPKFKIGDEVKLGDKGRIRMVIIAKEYQNDTYVYKCKWHKLKSQISKEETYPEESLVK